MNKKAPQTVKIIAGLAMIFTISFTQAQTVSLVFDANTIGQSTGTAAPMFVFNNKLYFSQNYGQYGSKLMMYTGSGTPGLATGIDLNQNSVGSMNVKHLATVYNGKMYFSGYHSWLGEEPTVYDGTTFSLLSDINSNGQGSSNPHDFVVLGSNLYFIASDGTGEFLWKYDGSNSPVKVVGTAFNNAKYLTVFNNKIYFQYGTSLHGVELWVYDGTNVPKMVKDMATGTTNFGPQYLTVFNNNLYFSGYTASTNVELFKIDLTDSIMLVADIYSGTQSSSPQSLYVFNNKLYFAANTPGNGAELMAYDGVNAPELIENIYAGSVGSFPGEFASLNGSLYFAANTLNYSRELHKYTPGNGVEMVKDIYEGGGTANANPGGLILFGNNIYFLANSETGGRELWKTDGTANGTVNVFDPTPGNEGMYFGSFATLNDNKLIYSARTQSGSYYDIWASNGNDSTYKISNSIMQFSTSPAQYLATLNGKMYFSGRTNFYGTEVMVTDGYSIDTAFDLSPGASSTLPLGIINFNNKLYFGSQNGTNNMHGKLWVYDGTNRPTEVATLNPNGYANFYGAKVVNGKLYFSASNGTDGTEPWVYDGVNPPTMIKNINPNGNSNADNFTWFNNKIYFSANDGVNGEELWVYDGTNCTMLAEQRPGNGGASFSYLTVYKEKLYYTFYHDNHGYEFWEMGTDNVPRLVLEPETGTSGLYPKYITELNGKLYFSGYTSSNGEELWVFDGNKAKRITDLAPGNVGGQFSNITKMNGELFFSAYTDNTNSELFKFCVPNSLVSQQGNTLMVNNNASSFKWIDCGNNSLISGANSASFTPPSSGGSYACIVTDVCGTDTSACFSLQTNSIYSISQELGITLYPNPTQDMLQIQTNQNVSVLEIILCNSIGQNLPANISNSVLNTAALPNGVYYLTITTNRGTTQASFLKIQ